MVTTLFNFGFHTDMLSMTHWEQPRFPPRTSSRRWVAPGIFVNVEFGVTVKPDDRPHVASLKYASKKMDAKLNEERIRQQYEDGLFLLQEQQERDLSRHPTILMPARGNPAMQNRQYEQQDVVERQRRLGVSMREQHERGTSAPPTITDRTRPISPVSPISPMSMASFETSFEQTTSMPSDFPFDISFNEITFQRSAPIESILQPERATPQMNRKTKQLRVNRDRINQQLPPSPSQFRLGEDDLPWSVQPWYRTPEPGVSTPPIPSIKTESSKLDDPQRVRDLETLHQAMMTVDSLSAEGWDDPSWQGFGDMPSGPRSLGWAVASTDASLRPTLSSPGPPPYVVSQWEQRNSRGRNRPRSAGNV